MYEKLSSAPWPQGFIDDLWDRGHDLPEKPTGLDPDELLGTAEYVLAAVKIKPRDKEILRQHYKDGLTFTRIAEMNNLTLSRITEMARRGLKDIRSARWVMELLSMGVRAYAQRDYKEQATEAFRKAVSTKAEELVEKQLPIETVVAEDTSMPIGELFLSTRSYNALKRAGLDTAGSILKLSTGYDLLKIRNLGINGIREILGKLESEGYDVTHLRDVEEKYEANRTDE